MRIGDLRTGEKYEQEKQARAARPAPTGVFDRQAGVRPEKKTDKDAHQKATLTLELTAPELPERLKPTPPPAVAVPATNGILTNGSLPNGPLTNGTTNATLPPPQEKKTRYVVQAPSGISALKLTSENATDLHILTKEEAELCSAIRVMPKPFVVMKEAIIRESTRNGGALKRKQVRDICKVWR